MHKKIGERKRKELKIKAITEYIKILHGNLVKLRNSVKPKELYIKEIEEQLVTLDERRIKLTRINTQDMMLGSIPGIKYKRKILNTLYNFDKKLQKETLSNTSSRRSFGRPLVSKEFNEIQLYERHKKALRTKSSTLGEWMSNQIRCDIKTLIKICEIKIKSSTTTVAKGGHEINSISIKNIISSNSNTYKYRFNKYFCNLCYRHVFNNGQYCEYHSPELDSKTAMNSYQKETRKLQKVADYIISIHPITEILFFKDIPKTFIGTPSPYRTKHPDLDIVWETMFTHFKWEFPDSGKAAILEDHDLLRDPVHWFDWAIAFTQFLSDLPISKHKICWLPQHKNESQKKWLESISLVLDNYGVSQILNDPEYLFTAFTRYDQYLLICDLAEKRIISPEDQELHKNIRILYEEEGLSYLKIGNKLGVSQSQAGKIGKELGLVKAKAVKLQ